MLPVGDPLRLQWGWALVRIIFLMIISSVVYMIMGFILKLRGGRLLEYDRTVDRSATKSKSGNLLIYLVDWIL